MTERSGWMVGFSGEVRREYANFPDIVRRNYGKVRGDFYVAVMSQMIVQWVIGGGKQTELEDSERDILDRLIKGEGKVEESLLRELGRRSRSAQSLKNIEPRVNRARRFLRSFIDSNPQTKKLRENDVFFVYYGSMQYGDPQNLDGDVLAVSDRSLTETEDRFVYDDIGNQLIELWEIFSLGAEPHLTHFSMDILRHPVKNFKKSPEDFCGDITDIGILLTCIPVLQEDGEKLLKMRREVRRLVDNEPLFAVIANHNLTHCLEIRKEREASRLAKLRSGNARVV